ncbi:MAG: hypothetical protein ACP5KN_13535, partial [Armatimonadota bacterium]
KQEEREETEEVPPASRSAPQPTPGQQQPTSDGPLETPSEAAQPVAAEPAAPDESSAPHPGPPSEEADSLEELIGGDLR